MKNLESQVGDYFKGRDGKVYQLVSYCSHPTVTFKEVKTGERVGGAVDCLNVQGIEYIESEETQKLLREVLIK
jgi:hypothetical protein